MKPIIVFTRYNEDHDEFVVVTSVSASVDGKVFEAIGLPMSSVKATDAWLDSRLCNLIEEVVNDALKHLTEEGKYGMDYRNMTLMDKLSAFDIKQTPEFNNALHHFCRDDSVLLAAIW